MQHKYHIPNVFVNIFFCFYVKGEIKGPEGFAVYDNTLYTGLKGGAIVKVVGDKLVPVADLSHPCGNLVFSFNTS